MRSFLYDQKWMNRAYEEASKAQMMDEVPVGAVIISSEGYLLAWAHNNKEAKNDVTSHAEIEALRMAAADLKSWRLEGCTLYVTLEPCPMCLSAISQSRIARVVFGAYDPKGGALSLGYNLYNDSRLNHRFEICGGVEHYKCSKLLSNYFKTKRKSYQLLK